MGTVIGLLGLVVFLAGLVGLFKPGLIKLSKRRWAGAVVVVGLIMMTAMPDESNVDREERERILEVHRQAGLEAKRIQEEKKHGEEREKRLEVAREERIEAGFDPWDGNHKLLERIIKEALNDPDSYEHDETIYRDQGDQLWVRTRFRARNMLGGVVRQQVMAQVDLDGNVLEILAHQQRGADGLYHDLE